MSLDVDHYLSRGDFPVFEKFDLTHVHHVNLLVRDIERAKREYRERFNIEFVDEKLPSRGAITSRFSLGESWIVLVQPIAEGEPMRQLRERGEGLFLLSLGVAQREKEVASSSSLNTGIISGLSEIRAGISGWRVADFRISGEPKGQLQLAFQQND
jgi:catechol 2,3-dioxygenase-like lactoylglutathione lyase family enzyme